MARTNTVIDEMRKQFDKNLDKMGIDTIALDGGMKFRRTNIDKVIKALGSSPASAASAYNTVRKERIKDNTIPPNLLGRSAAKKAVPSDKPTD